MLRDLHRRGERKFIKATGSELLQRKDVFRTRYGSFAYELQKFWQCVNTCANSCVTEISELRRSVCTKSTFILGDLGHQ